MKIRKYNVVIAHNAVELTENVNRAMNTLENLELVGGVNLYKIGTDFIYSQAFTYLGEENATNS